MASERKLLNLSKRLAIRIICYVKINHFIAFNLGFLCIQLLYNLEDIRLKGRTLQIGWNEIDKERAKGMLNGWNEIDKERGKGMLNGWNEIDKERGKGM